VTEVQKKYIIWEANCERRDTSRGRVGLVPTWRSGNSTMLYVFLQAFIHSSSSVSFSNLSHDIVSTLLSVIFLDHSEKVTIIITHCVITTVLQAVSKFICTVYFISLHFFICESCQLTAPWGLLKYWQSLSRTVPASFWRPKRLVTLLNL